MDSDLWDKYTFKDLDSRAIPDECQSDECNVPIQNLSRSHPIDFSGAFENQDTSEVNLKDDQDLNQRPNSTRFDSHPL